MNRSTLMAIWFVWAFICMAVGASMIYVAVHFISKVW